MAEIDVQQYIQEQNLAGGWRTMRAEFSRVNGGMTSQQRTVWNESKTAFLAQLEVAPTEKFVGLLYAVNRNLWDDHGCNSWTGFTLEIQDGIVQRLIAEFETENAGRNTDHDMILYSYLLANKEQRAQLASAVKHPDWRPVLEELRNGSWQINLL